MTCHLSTMDNEIMERSVNEETAWAENDTQRFWYLSSKLANTSRCKPILDIQPIQETMASDTRRMAFQVTNANLTAFQISEYRWTING